MFATTQNVRKFEKFVSQTETQFNSAKNFGVKSQMEQFFV